MVILRKLLNLVSCKNIAEDIRPGCKNLLRSLIIVNLSEIFLGGMMLKRPGWTKISSIDIGEGSCYC